MTGIVELADEVAKRAAMFRNGELDKVLRRAASILIQDGNQQAAALLAEARISVSHSRYDNWNGGQDFWLLSLVVPEQQYFELQGREKLEERIKDAVAIPASVVSEADFFECKITTELQADPDWRQKTRQQISGKPITNQGRAHSQNVAAVEHDNLLFRSKPEICFYRALKSLGVVFAPLPVIVQGNVAGQKPARIEPDFIIFKDGLVTIVEIDTDAWHRETPHKAHVRLKFLLDEGARLERIGTNECDTYEKAREAADRILLGIEKRRRSRV